MGRPLWFRILNATALAMFLTAALAGVVGFASADPEMPEGGPTTLRIAEPRVGDRGTYNVTLVREAGDDVEVVRAEHVLHRFEVLPPELQRDQDGILHRVNRVLEVPFGVNETGQWQQYAAPVYAFDALDQRLISYSYLTDEAQGEQSYRMRQTMILDGELHAAPCGLDLRGRASELDLSKSVRPFWMCSWEAYWSAEAMAFEARGTQQVGSLETVYFTSIAGSRIHLWLADGFPYPIKYAVEDQDERGLFHVIRLVAFDRGSAPLATSGPPPSEPAPVLEYAPLEPWGLPEGTLDHPFPLSQAYRDALAHPDAHGMRELLRRAPDALVVWSTYRFDQHDNITRHAWTMIVSSGTGGLTVTFEQQVEEVASLFGPSRNRTTYQYSEQARDNERWMSRADVLAAMPHGLPTAESLQRLWKAYATEGHGERDPNAYGAMFRCVGSCGRTLVELEAGYTWSQTTTRSEPGVPLLMPGPAHVESYNNQSMFSIRIDTATGIDYGLLEYTNTYTSGGQNSAAATDAHPKATMLTAAVAPLWAFPSTSAVAGAGALGLVVAVAYLLWPSLKAAGFLGLFSRVREDKLLENPIRRSLVDAVEGNPGIHYQDLVRLVGKGNGTVEHHLRKLVEARLVACVKGPGYTCYFPGGRYDAEARLAAPALKADGAKRIMAAVLADPGVAPSVVARRIGLSQPTVTYHMHRLEEAGLVVAQRHGRASRLFPTAAARKTAQGT